MKKTKIAFEDIKSGDLLEVVHKASGVHEVLTGIAFESEKDHQGETVWMTSEGGAIALEWDRDTIYRVDVSEDTFEDIRKGDLIRVTTTAGDTKVSIEGRAHRFVKSDEDWRDTWCSEQGYVLMHRKFRGSTVEIVERAEDNG